MAAVLARLRRDVAREPLLWAYLALVLAALAAAAALREPLLAAAPAAVLAVGVAVLSPRSTWLACFGLIPLSTELQLGALGLDFPAEPVMLLLTGVAAVWVLRHPGLVSARLVRHPVTLLLAAHLAWIALASVASAEVWVSAKYFLAKLWYVVPFYAATALLLRGEADLRAVARWVALPLSAVLAWCLVRHASYGFSFADVNSAMAPFFRNHVSYAALTSITVPLFAYGAATARTRSGRWGFGVAAALALAAVYTSYTRAAFVSLAGGVALVYVIRWRLTRPALLAATAALVLGVTFVISDNRFFNFAPDYNKAVTHRDFGNLLEATYKLEDISTMERVYRWVAGGYMAAERPLLGWGPGTFYGHYKGYALESFRTYVSDNPEKSGVHNYLLMLLVEQGWPGMLLFVALAVAGLTTAERAYHRAATPAERAAVLALASSLAVNLSFQLINDMIETDKSGPWFFLALAGLVVLDLRSAPGRPEWRRGDR